MEIVPGIHQLKLPVPMLGDLLAVNAYLVKGDDGWLLIDTGWNTNQTFSALERQLAEIGVRPQDLRLIVITHFHPDHYGLAGRLVQLSGAGVALHLIEKAFIDARYLNMGGLLDETARLLRLHGVPEPELPRLQKASLGVRQFVSPITPDVTLQGGETISHGAFSFKVIWTAGHSPGHICLYDSERKLLISGDHVLPLTFPNVGLHPQSGENPLGNYLKSLSIVEQLDVNLVLPAHEHVFTNLKERVGEIRRHHESRRSAITEVLEDCPGSAYQVSHRIPWIVNGVTMSFAELHPLDKRLAVMSALAHLEPLCDEGEVERIDNNGTLLYNLSRPR
jgi:glyoxylase-like metal-dependent hydrolase (beta-lactamase superfamily II)